VALGIGIIGLGAISDFHARAAQAISEKTLVACCSRNAEKAKAFADRYHCRAYTSTDEFLRHPGLDIVSVTTAAGHHLEPALAAIDAGKHVIIEKPFEVTAERCLRIIERAERKGVLTAGIFQSRFSEVAQLIKKHVDGGRLGCATLGDAYVKWIRGDDYFRKTPGRGTWAYDGGGALMNQGIHAVDLLQWIMGPVQSLQAYTATIAHAGVEVEDNAVAALRFKNGAFGVIEASTSVYPGFLKRIEVSGTNGTAILEEQTLKTWEFRDNGPEDKEILRRFGATESGAGGASDPLAIDFSGHRRQFEDFINAIESGTRPLVDGAEAKKAVDIVLAIYRSARERREISP
jgi:UDP-N-acetyl-2-amino-2-deoxyglucuronate dehydrogenase